jgi:phage terminase large subunit-like protein
LSQLIDDGLRGHDPTTITHLYAVPDDAENVFTDERLWKKANPALGDFRSLPEMRTAARRAKRMPTFESAFRNLYLNQRVNVQSPLIPRGEWEGCQGDDRLEGGMDVYLGLDLSSKTDLTALVAISGGDREVCRAWFWKPGESLAEHEKRDRVPYTVWKAQGILETTPGKAIQYGWIAERLAEIFTEFNVLGVAYDRWRMEDLLNALKNIGVECYVDNGKEKVQARGVRFVPWGQGYVDMTPAVEALEVSILERRFVHDGNPVLTWNISNAIAIADPAGNRKLDKSKTRFRIDGAVAAAMACGLKSRDTKEQVKSAYDGLDEEGIKNRIAF